MDMNDYIKIAMLYLAFGSFLLAIVLYTTGCASTYDWILDRGNDIVWKEPPAETILVTDLSGYPMAERKPSVQEMRVIFEDGAIQLKLQHEADHWGEVGTGSGLVVKGDEEMWVNVNVLIRKRYGPETAVDAPVEIPKQTYHWRRWQTANGKTMLMDGGIDLHALKCVIKAAPDFGIDGMVLQAESIGVTWQ